MVKKLSPGLLKSQFHQNLICCFSCFY